MTIVWLEFLLTSFIIFFFGIQLARYGYKLSQKSVFSEGLIGILFLATVTSFPEIFTAIGSVTRVDAPGLALGEVAGSVIFNLMIIVLLDYQQGKRSIFFRNQATHFFTCSLTVLLLGIVGLSLLVKKFTGGGFGVFGFGFDSLLIILIYMVGLRLIYRRSRKERGAALPGVNPGRLWVKFLISGVIIVIAGFHLASLGDRIVKMSGLSEMYIGTILLAFTTSLPEIVVASSALRAGSLDMALGNIFGSNFFDMAIIPLTDAFFRKGQLLIFVSGDHIYSITLAIILTLVVMLGLRFRVRRSLMRLSWPTWIMVLIFILGNYGLAVLLRR